MTSTIPQQLKNIAADHDVSQMIPRAFVPLEIVAAASLTAKALAGAAEPDRHHYLRAIPQYLATLPNSVELAQSVIKIDAAAVLGIPGLVADHAILADAQRELSEAQAKVDEAERIQGRRLGRIHRLESDIEQANRELESWNIDFDAEEAAAEAAILEHWGKGYPVNFPFDTLAKTAVLRRLAPGAIAAIKDRISTAQAELDQLRTGDATNAPTPAPAPAVTDAHVAEASPNEPPAHDEGIKSIVPAAARKAAAA